MVNRYIYNLLFLIKLTITENKIQYSVNSNYMLRY